MVSLGDRFSFDLDHRRQQLAADARRSSYRADHTDIALLNSMLYVMLEENLIDRDFVARHADGFAELLKVIKKYPPRVAGRDLWRPRMSHRGGGVHFWQGGESFVALEHGGESEHRGRP